jgi:hypothetical protein
MIMSTCKKCGKRDILLRTIWQKDKYGCAHPVVLCRQCFAHAQYANEVTALFGNLKKPPKNGDLINE